MENRFEKNNNKRTGNRIKDIGIQIPKIRSELFFRLFSLLGTYPEIGDEGYEFFIKDKLTGLEFSVGLNGFGPGYFSSDHYDNA